MNLSKFEIVKPAWLHLLAWLRRHRARIGLTAFGAVLKVALERVWLCHA